MSRGVYGLTFVSEPTLVETEGPIGDLCGSTDDLGVLARYFDRIRGTAGQEIEVDHSSNDVVLERCSRSAVILVDLDIHSVRVEKEDAMGAGGTVLEVDGVVSVQVGVISDTVGIPGPESAGVIVNWQTEAVSVLAQTVDVRVCGQTGLDTDVLRLKD